MKRTIATSTPKGMDMPEQKEDMTQTSLNSYTYTTAMAAYIMPAKLAPAIMTPMASVAAHITLTPTHYTT
jgi:hypothetical protein